MTTPKVEQRHRDAARKWLKDAAASRQYGSELEPLCGPVATAYALGLAQGEQDGIRKGLERAAALASAVVCEDDAQRYGANRVWHATRRALEELDHE